MNQNQSGIIILDLRSVIDKYESHPTVAERLPWMDVQTLMALGLSEALLPYGAEETIQLVERIIYSRGYRPTVEMDYFEKIEEIINLMVGDVDTLIQYHNQKRQYDPFSVVFYKWLNPYTIALECPYGNSYEPQTFQASRRRALDYLFETTGIRL